MKNNSGEKENRSVNTRLKYAVQHSYKNNLKDERLQIDL